MIFNFTKKYIIMKLLVKLYTGAYGGRNVICMASRKGHLHSCFTKPCVKFTQLKRPCKRFFMCFIREVIPYHSCYDILYITKTLC